jgi:hypothetical protein
MMYFKVTPKNLPTGTDEKYETPVGTTHMSDIRNFPPLLSVSVQLANKRGFNKEKKKVHCYAMTCPLVREGATK